MVDAVSAKSPASAVGILAGDKATHVDDVQMRDAIDHFWSDLGFIFLTWNILVLQLGTWLRAPEQTAQTKATDRPGSESCFVSLKQ
ncbi:hypothetical protein [Gymnodinialimonas mytili]|uniref:hypothetical protein n=1 Tax=Gymnodinialimonas mytili TaxID=3126503 RepID=UPI0030EC650A